MRWGTAVLFGLLWLILLIGVIRSNVPECTTAMECLDVCGGEPC